MGTLLIEAFMTYLDELIHQRKLCRQHFVFFGHVLKGLNGPLDVVDVEAYVNERARMDSARDQFLFLKSQF
jgi:hypothetical protein